MKKTRLFAAFLTLIGCATVAICANPEVEASEATNIEAFARYDFEDAANPGKDSSVHGFDLKKVVSSPNADAMQIVADDDGDSYISIRRDEYDDGKSKNTGAYLYAPQQGNSSFDFSDMISGSYTVSMRLRSENSRWWGDTYAVTFGRYNGCLTIVPWKGCISVQLYNLAYAPGATVDEKHNFCEGNITDITYDTNDWVDITITADADTNLHCVYINGELAFYDNLPGTKLTASEYDDYTFAIGAQCNIYGNSATQYGNVDLKNVVIYDCALSEANVKSILGGNEATLENQEEGTVYVTALEAINMDNISLEINDVNTLQELMTNALPSKVKATLSNGIERSFPVYWYEAPGQKIKGYVQTGYANPSLTEIELAYNYTLNFDYDASLVTVKNLKLDGADYELGTPITPSKHTLSFELELAPGVVLNSVDYFGMPWDPEEGEMLWYIDITEGALIVIDAEVQSYKVTYMDGDKKLGTSKYTQGGSEALNTYDKAGYTFVGWFTDTELTTEFTGLDYANPSDVTLYAKYEAINNNGGNNNGDNNTDDGKKGCGGCGGSIVISLLGFTSLAGAAYFLKKRKENN